MKYSWEFYGKATLDKPEATQCELKNKT